MHELFTTNHDEANRAAVATVPAPPGPTRRRTRTETYSPASTPASLVFLLHKATVARGAEFGSRASSTHARAISHRLVRRNRDDRLAVRPSGEVQVISYVVELCAQRNHRTRYRLCVAATRGTQDKGVISQLSDAGEDALRRLFGLPRRIVVGALDGVAERLQDVATKLGAIDPLDGRVTAIERRLDSLEKPKKTTARTASRRAKPSRARKASTAAVLEPEQGEEQGEPEHARGHRAEAQAENEREQDGTTART
jgi:hypothetical protein